MLLLILIVLGGLAVAGSVAGVVLYDQATKIDRSTPAVSARQFLSAALANKDVVRTALFVCNRWPAEQALTEARKGIDTSAEVSYGVGTVENIDERNATVPVRVLTATGSGATVSEETIHWTLQLVKEDGWRVCGINRE